MCNIIVCCSFYFLIFFLYFLPQRQLFFYKGKAIVYALFTFSMSFSQLLIRGQC